MHHAAASHVHAFPFQPLPTSSLFFFLTNSIHPRKQVGFPIMIKATAGGGGRGMRLAMHEGEFLSLMRAAQQEAESAFGNGAVYLERYVSNPRHIEFQAGSRGREGLPASHSSACQPASGKGRASCPANGKERAS